MTPFPGQLLKVGRYLKITLNEEQETWLRRWYPTTENKRLAKAMGVGLTKINDFSRQYGLVKSESGMEAIRRRQVKAMIKTNTKNGCYDRKRGHPASEATLEGCRRRWEEYRQGLRLSTYETLRMRDPKKYEAVKEMRSKNRKDLIYKEKRRVLYGLERKTKIKPVVMSPYTRSQLHHRYNALRRGYLLDCNCSEGQPGRYIIYYDDDTHRSEQFESNCIKDGFTFKRDE